MSNSNRLSVVNELFAQVSGKVAAAAMTGAAIVGGSLIPAGDAEASCTSQVITSIPGQDPVVTTVPVACPPVAPPISGGSVQPSTPAPAPITNTSESNAAAIAAAQAAARAAAASNATGGSVGNVAGGSVGDINIDASTKQAKQATHIGSVIPTATISGCVEKGAIVIQGSVVGAGALGVGIPLRASIVEGCPEYMSNMAVVTNGLASSEPADKVAAYRVAGHADQLTYLHTPEGQKDMTLFGRSPANVGASAVTYIAPPPAAVQFAGAAAPAPIPACTTTTPGHKAMWVTNPKTNSTECVLKPN